VTKQEQAALAAQQPIGQVIPPEVMKAAVVEVLRQATKQTKSTRPRPVTRVRRHHGRAARPGRRRTSCRRVASRDGPDPDEPEPARGGQEPCRNGCGREAMADWLLCWGCWNQRFRSGPDELPEENELAISQLALFMAGER
jgi:hypothetical protein